MLMTDFIVVSSDLRSYIFDTWVKRGAELSTGHYPVMSWIRWRGRKPVNPGRSKCVVRVFWKHLAEEPARQIFTPLTELQPHPEGLLRFGNEILPQVEVFKYLGEIDTWIGAASAVVRSLYRSVLVKRELSQKARLSVDLCSNPHLWS